MSILRNLKIIIDLPSDIWLMIISYLPGPVGFFLRFHFWKTRLRYLGVNVRIDTGVYFQNPDCIIIQDNCWLDKNVIILAGLDQSNREKIVIKNKYFKGEPGVVYIGKNIHVGSGCIISGISAGVYIGDDCGFSANCKVYSFTHHYKSRKNPEDFNIHFGPMASQERQCLVEGSISIGHNTGVALNSVILPGVALPDNCFIAINSVVHAKRFISNSIISGDPAKTIEKRFKVDE